MTENLERAKPHHVMHVTGSDIGGAMLDRNLGSDQKLDADACFCGNALRSTVHLSLARREIDSCTKVQVRPYGINATAEEECREFRSNCSW